MPNIMDVEKIGPKHADKFNKAGISTTDDLLKAGATPKGRKDLAEKTGVEAKLILEWVNFVDLYRIKGVGSEYSQLLEQAGVNTIPELAQRNAANLLKEIEAINKKKNLVNKLPTESQLDNWIDQAKKLPRVITY